MWCVYMQWHHSWRCGASRDSLPAALMQDLQEQKTVRRMRTWRLAWMAASSGATSCTVATLSGWFFAGHFSDSLQEQRTAV